MSTAFRAQHKNEGNIHRSVPAQKKVFFPPVLWNHFSEGKRERRENQFLLFPIQAVTPSTFSFSFSPPLPRGQIEISSPYKVHSSSPPCTLQRRCRRCCTVSAIPSPPPLFAVSQSLLCFPVFSSIFANLKLGLLYRRDRHSDPVRQLGKRAFFHFFFPTQDLFKHSGQPAYRGPFKLIVQTKMEKTGSRRALALSVNNEERENRDHSRSTWAHQARPSWLD